MDEHENEPCRMSRRQCLSWLARAAVSTVALRPACAWAGDEKDPVKIANLFALPNESARLFEKPEAIIVRTSKGIACMSVYCTHKHNKLEVDPDGTIVCPVHSSTFDLSGKPTGGPASKPLSWYQVEVRNNGDILVDMSKGVEQGAWAALPAWARPKAK